MESQFKTHPNLNGDESKKGKELLGVLLESYWLIQESFRKSDQETKTIALNRIREALNEFDIPEKHLNPHGATSQELKEQELLDSLLIAEFALSDSKTLEEKKRALAQVNLALEAIEKLEGEKKENQGIEARVIQNERLQNWQNPEWMDRQLDELSNLKEMGYSESQAEKYVESKDYSKFNWCHPHDDVQWDNQSWE